MPPRNPVPKEYIHNIKKAVIFPYCISPCIENGSDDFYRCKDPCSDCLIGELRPDIEKMGYEVLIAGSDDSVREMVKGLYDKGKSITAMGVSCKLSKHKLESDIDANRIKDVFKAYDHYVIPKICMGSNDKKDNNARTKISIEKSEFLNSLKKLG